MAQVMVLKGKTIASKAYARKEGRLKTNELRFQLKKNQQQKNNQKIKLKNRRR